MTNAKRIRLYLIGVLIGSVFVYVYYSKKEYSKGWLPKDVIRKQLLEKPLVYTKHARCRMACREVTEEEIKAILADGTIHLGKSDVGDRPCPSYVVEGRSKDGQELRVVFGACEADTRVITAIDLGEEHRCDCK